MRAYAKAVIQAFLLLLACVVWLLVLETLIAKPAHAQASTAKSAEWGGPFNYGYVTDSARTFLEQGWDEHNATQVERAFCIEPSDVAVDSVSDRANTTWRIHHVTAPDSLEGATPYGISFHCSATAIGSMHTHTPTTCVRAATDPYGAHPTKCVLGGLDGYVCSVDEQDRRAGRDDMLVVIQCGRGQFVFYWPKRRG